METNVVLLILATGVVGFAVFILLQWRKTRQAAGRTWYGIEQQGMKRHAFWLGLQVTVLLLAGAFVIAILARNLRDQATQSPAGDQALPQPQITVSILPTPAESVTPPTVAPIDDPLVGGTVPPPTAVDGEQMTLVPIPTIPMTIQATITNTNGGGLWLRDAPFGNGLVLLEEGSTVLVRGGLMEVEGFMWQSVEAPDGRTGWVAADYLIYR